MPVDSTHLLRRLDRPIRPTGETDAQQVWSAALASRTDRADEYGGIFDLPSADGAVQVPFERLIRLATRGELTTCRAIRVDESITLSAKERDQIAAAADRAQAAGSRQALVLTAQRALRLDVEARRITEEILMPQAPADENGHAASDSASRAGSSSESSETTAPPLSPLRSGLHPLRFESRSDASGKERMITDIDTAIILVDHDDDSAHGLSKSTSQGARFGPSARPFPGLGYVAPPVNETRSKRTE